MAAMVVGYVRVEDMKWKERDVFERETVKRKGSTAIARLIKMEKGGGQLFSDLGLASSVPIDPVSISSRHQSRLGCLAALCLGYETS
ncbi:uncharacterized protein A4U43_C08F12880 [Asparagus officinalis]|nr:uncharacterized protein A4U43_C08F12880 [Asparagus officinalis]